MLVCKWLGNSEQGARKHYLQVTDDHYAKALLIAMSEVGGTECGTVDCEIGPKAAQNAAQQAVAQTRTESQNSSIEGANVGSVRSGATECDLMQVNKHPLGESNDRQNPRENDPFQMRRSIIRSSWRTKTPIWLN